MRSKATRARTGNCTPVGNVAGRAEIDLRHFVRRLRAGVLDVDLDVETAIRGSFDREVGVVEGGVAEAVAEGEERLDVLLVEPAIADVDAFAVGGLAVDALMGALGMLGIGGGIVRRGSCPR